MIRLACIAALILLAGCYVRTLHEPALCAAERLDTVTVVLVNNQPPVVVTQETCTLWVAFSDSTVCWNGDGERLGSCTP